MTEMVHDLLQISSGLPGACDHSIPYDATPGPLSTHNGIGSQMGKRCCLCNFL